ncbi:MAG: hypothetical protein MHM6MM_000844 [Cercozoa sp. M6MM]
MCLCPALLSSRCLGHAALIVKRMCAELQPLLSLLGKPGSVHSEYISLIGTSYFFLLLFASIGIIVNAGACLCSVYQYGHLQKTTTTLAQQDLDTPQDPDVEKPLSIGEINNQNLPSRKRSLEAQIPLTKPKTRYCR